MGGSSAATSFGVNLHIFLTVYETSHYMILFTRTKNSGIPETTMLYCIIDLYLNIQRKYLHNTLRLVAYL